MDPGRPMVWRIVVHSYVCRTTACAIADVAVKARSAAASQGWISSLVRFESCLEMGRGQNRPWIGWGSSSWNTQKSCLPSSLFQHHSQPDSASKPREEKVDALIEDDVFCCCVILSRGPPSREKQESVVHSAIIHYWPHSLRKVLDNLLNLFARISTRSKKLLGTKDIARGY